MFNLRKFSSTNKIPATKALILVSKIREIYAKRIIKDRKISKNTYLELNKKNLYIISEIDNMFRSHKYKELNILSYLLRSSVPIQNIPIGLVSGYLTHNPIAVLETIGNAFAPLDADFMTSYKNFKHPKFFDAPFIPNTEVQSTKDLKNILESMPVEWIDFSLKGKNIIDIVKTMCETNYDFSKIHKNAIRSLKSNKNILSILDDCPNLKGFLVVKK